MPIRSIVEHARAISEKFFLNVARVLVRNEPRIRDTEIPQIMLITYLYLIIQSTASYGICVLLDNGKALGRMPRAGGLNSHTRNAIS